MPAGLPARADLAHRPIVAGAPQGHRKITPSAPRSGPARSLIWAQLSGYIIAMTDTFEYATRPGSTGLSILSFAGLSALTVFLWQISPGYVLLLMVPALLMCLWQITRVPTYGIRMTGSTWNIMGGQDDLVIPTAQIAYLRVVERGANRRIGLMLEDGTEVVLPLECLPDPYDLIREATNRGIPVRQQA
ncbi:hypothetical protein A8B78_19970 [Jannaschia sp. EhC01]|nr:hypothetical protein A8B78_19970 [Jannaschia sp. EhC01]